MSTTPDRLLPLSPVDDAYSVGSAGAKRTLAHHDPAAGVLLVEVHRTGDAARLRHDWADLVDRCLEPNAFMDPDFCLPLMAHAAPRRLIVLSVRARGDAASGGKLIAVCPLLLSGAPFGRLVASWEHELCALAAPMLDREAAAPALDAILAWLARFRPACGAWLIPATVADGPTAQLIATVAQRTGRPVHRFDRGRRAVLRASADEPAGLAAVSVRKAKDLRRLRRRLAARGELSYLGAASGEAVRAAAESFLRLEARGWKGRRQTALALRAGQAAFTRAMVAGMTARGRCRIDSLTLEGRPIAMGIVLSSAGRDFFWKTAYDESLAGLSPGVQFVLDLTRRQTAGDRQPDLTDSCARPDHPMIDHLWRGRIDMAGLLIGVRPDTPARFARTVRLEQLRASARALLQRAVARLRRRFGH